MRVFNTTTDFINNHVNSGGYTANDIIKTLGYSSQGGVGGARWKATGSVIAVSQDPITLNDIKLSDASGNEFELVLEEAGIIDLNVLGGTSASYINIADAAGLTYSQGLTSDVSNDIKSQDTVDTMVNASGFSVGNAVNTKEFSTGNGGGGTYDVVLTSSVTPNTYNIIIGVADPLISFVLRNDEPNTGKQYGMAGDDSIDDRASLAVIDGDGAFKLTKGTYKISSDITLTSDIDFESGAVLKPDTGVTITIDGSVNSGLYRIFEADDDGTTGAIRGTLNGTKTWGEWWGALPDVSAGVAAQLNEALQHCKARVQGGLLYRGDGQIILEAKILIPNKTGYEGVSYIGSKILLKAGVALGVGNYLFENETKSGPGQSFMHISKMQINGNRANGATGGGILGQQIFVNSLFSDLLVQEFSGNNIALIALSTDDPAQNNLGPVELRNVWSFSCAGQTLRIEGDCKDVNIIGGAYEKHNDDGHVIVIDGSLHGGTRAHVNGLGVHLEFGGANQRGISINRGVVAINGLTSVGAQQATQTNVYVVDDDISNVTLTGVEQSVGVRTGINFAVSGLINNENYIGSISTKDSLSVAPHASDGSVGADITVDANWGNVLSLSAGSATSIANFSNTQKGLLLVRIGSANYTIRHNANIQLASGADHVMTSGDMVAFVRINDVFYEIKGTV